MVQLKSKGSQKRSAETSSTSPHLKKRRVVPVAPQKSGAADDGQKSSKVPKKLSKVSQVKSTKTSLTSPRPVKKQVQPAAPQKSVTKANGQNDSRVPKKLVKGSQKKSAETSTSPLLKKKRALHVAPQKSEAAAKAQNGSKVPKKLTKEMPEKRKKAFQLFVRNIPKKFGKEDLAQHFSQFGGIKSIGLPTKVKDRSAHRGFAFIEFHDKVALKKALTAGENKVQVDGKMVSLRVLECKEAAPQTTNFAAQVLVRLIPEKVSKNILKQHFSQFGSVKRIIFPKKSGNPSEHQGFAYVEFEEELAKKKAVKADHEVNGQPISVVPSKFSESVQKKEINYELEVYVSKIPQELSKEDLEEHFSQFGRIKRLALPTQAEDRSAHRGFAYIEFHDKRAKKKVLLASHHEVNEYVVSVRAIKSSESVAKKDTKHALEVFVSQIPEEVGKKHLSKHFSQFGKVESITLPVKAEDPSAHRGYAFIQFADDRAKKEALATDQLEFRVDGKVTSLRVSDVKANLSIGQMSSDKIQDDELEESDEDDEDDDEDDEDDEEDDEDDEEDDDEDDEEEDDDDEDDEEEEDDDDEDDEEEDDDEDDEEESEDIEDSDEEM